MVYTKLNLPEQITKSICKYSETMFQMSQHGKRLGIISYCSHLCLTELPKNS